MPRDRQAKTKKKYYTAEEANAALPLVRRIVEDISTLAHAMRERHQRLTKATQTGQGKLTAAHAEEVQQMQETLDHDAEQLRDYIQELEALSVELKDYFLGLIDFRAKMDGREVYLCWKLGEPYVGHWHELDAGFAGRKSLVPDASVV